MKKRVIRSLQNFILLTATISILIAVAEWSVRALALIDNVETLDEDGSPIYVPAYFVCGEASRGGCGAFF